MPSTGLCARHREAARAQHWSLQSRTLCGAWLLGKQLKGCERRNHTRLSATRRGWEHNRHIAVDRRCAAERNQKCYAERGAPGAGRAEGGSRSMAEEERRGRVAASKQLTPDLAKHLKLPPRHLQPARLRYAYAFHVLGVKVEEIGEGAGGRKRLGGHHAAVFALKL